MHKPHAAKVLSACERAGIEPPAHFLNPPELRLGLQLFFDAFEVLSEEREYSETAIVRIKRRAVVEWLDENGFADNRELREEMLAYVRAMDNAFIPVEVAKRKRKKAELRRNEREQAGGLREKTTEVQGQHTKARERNQKGARTGNR